MNSVDTAARPLLWDQQTITRFWAHYAKNPATYFSEQFGYDIVRQASGYIPKGASVLDYACGTGGLIRHLLDRGYRVTGTEADSSHIALQKYSNEPNFSGMIATDRLLTEGKTYDAAFLIEVVEHVYDDELHEILSNIRNLLKPGATLIVTTPNDENLADQTVYCPVSNVTFHRWQHVRSWTAQSLRDTLVNAGFQKCETLETAFRPKGHSRARAIASSLLFPKRKMPNLMAAAVR